MTGILSAGELLRLRRVLFGVFLEGLAFDMTAVWKDMEAIVQSDAEHEDRVG